MMCMTLFSVMLMFRNKGIQLYLRHQRYFTIIKSAQNMFRGIIC